MSLFISALRSSKSTSTRFLRVIIPAAFMVFWAASCKQRSTTTEWSETNADQSRKHELKPAAGPPSSAPPEMVETDYDPGADPQNLTGYDLSKSRAPEDPRDRKKKPFSITALYKLKNVGSPTVSPDGERILFTVTSHNLKTGRSNSEIYMVHSDGSNPKRMTRRDGGDTNPMWSADSRFFFFVSTRSDPPQLWKMDIDGGEPEQVTSFPLGISNPVISTDGSKIAFTARVYPGLEEDPQANKTRAEKRRKSHFNAHIAEELLFRHWSFYKNDTRTHTFVLDLKTGQTTNVSPGDFDSPAFSPAGGGIALSPDGREVCFMSNREEPDARAWTTNKDLFVVSTGRGSILNITEANKAFDGYPSYSPDGRRVAFLRQEIPGYESDRPRLAVYERDTGKTRILTENFDSWVIDHKWHPDGRSIVFKAAVKARFPLFRVDVETGEIEHLSIPSVREFAVGKNGELVFTFSRIGLPMELYSMVPGKNKIRRLTGFNDSVVEKYDIRPAEEVSVKGADGKPVHMFIVKPHGFRKGNKYPLVLNIHGGPQYQWADTFRGDWQVYPGAGYVKAFPNPHGSIGFGQEYTRAISEDWGGKVYEDIEKVTEWLAEQPYVDPQKMGVMGWSYGGYMVNYLLGRNQSFKAAVSMMGIFDLESFYYSTEELWFPEWDIPKTPWENPEAYRKWSPSTHADKINTPTLILAGKKDFRVPYTQSIMMFTALKRRGVPAKLVLFPDDGHWPNTAKSMPIYYSAHLEWFHRYLGGQKPEFSPKELVYGKAFEKTKQR